MERGRWVTFDCFGTLVDWHNGFAAVVAPIAGERTADVLREYHRFERLLERESPHRSYRDVLTEPYARAARSVGVPLTGAEARQLPDSWSRLPVFGDVEPMLVSLREAGYRLGVLTNCDEDLFEATHRGFLRRFDVVVTAERVRDYKPAPAHFRYFARLTGAERGDWVHVACSFFHDVAPARELSVRCVWLDRDRTGEDPGAAAAYARAAAEVPPAVEALFGSPARLRGDDSMDDERDHIVAAYRRLLELWNQRDADGFAAAFTDNGSSIGFDGSQMNGRTEIALELRRIFASHPTAAYVARLREIRPLGSGVVLVRATVGMISPGKTALNPDVNAVQSVVFVSDGGEYRIALLHNTPAAFHGRPHLSEQLTDELTEVLRSGQVVVV